MFQSSYFSESFSDFKSAKSAFEENRNKLEVSGLKGWCCGFRSSGVSLSL